MIQVFESHGWEVHYDPDESTWPYAIVNPVSESEWTGLASSEVEALLDALTRAVAARGAQ